MVLWPSVASRARTHEHAPSRIENRQYVGAGEGRELLGFERNGRTKRNLLVVRQTGEPALSEIRVQRGFECRVFRQGCDRRELLLLAAFFE